MLFKSWFVDFDPVRAKMEGWDPENPIMKRILNNLHESQTLTAQRDTLLPKLG